MAMRNKGWTPNPKPCTWACKGMSTLITLYFIYFLVKEADILDFFKNKKLMTHHFPLILTMESQVSNF